MVAEVVGHAAALSATAKRQHGEIQAAEQHYDVKTHAHGRAMNAEGTRDGEEQRVSEQRSAGSRH
jgi:hypothetical protein